MVRVVDGWGGVVPVGVPGEIAGVGFGSGVFGSAGFDCGAFCGVPFGEPGSRMYLTGDLVRWTLMVNLSSWGE